MAEITCDVAIVGAGTAGLAAERSARRQGARTLLIDEAFRGTTCTTVGCMPSKLLIAAGNAAEAVRRAEIFGINATADIDGSAVMARLRHERDGFAAGVKASLRQLPDGVMHKGRATFDGPRRLKLDNRTIVNAKAVVIAVGAAPSIPDLLEGLAPSVLTNETLFELPHLPASVGVVGAGPLGLELAQALSRLGVKVAVFDEGDTLAGLKNAEVAAQLRTLLAREFPIHLGVKLVARREGTSVLLSWSGDSEGEAQFEYVLAATGRPPRLAGLGLETTGLTLDEHGAPSVNPQTLQCGGAPIFIAGDADHQRPVLHEAQAEGTIAGHNAATFPQVTPGGRTTPLSIMFTDPAVAVVGKISDVSGPDVLSGSASYQDQGRAKVFATNAGIAKIFADQGGRIIAAAVVGPGAEHSAHLLAWAIQQKLTADALLQLPFYHPTYEEGLKPALREVCKAAGRAVPMDGNEGFIPPA